MKVKTQDLTGPALDWAVAKAEDNEDCRDPYVTRTRDGMETYVKVTTFSGYEADWEPSADWSQAGPIIDREDIHWGFGTKDGNKVVIASKLGHHVKPLLGPTPLIAAMRCYVDSILGNKIEIPEELIET